MRDVPFSDVQAGVPLDVFGVTFDAREIRFGNGSTFGQLSNNESLDYFGEGANRA
jgi:hypothetical protein